LPPEFAALAGDYAAELQQYLRAPFTTGRAGSKHPAALAAVLRDLELLEERRMALASRRENDSAGRSP
jgi:hypothetical protein